MKKILFTLIALAMATLTLQAKTLIVFYSFTNNCRTIANDLKGQLTDADLVEVRPAEEGIDYAANNYAIGSALISAIRNQPNDAASYPAIKQLNVDFTLYNDIVIATPLWWSNMAAPMQTFLFQNGSKMAEKKVGLIVSSASSGISSVVSDAKRLIPQGDFTDNLWIRSSEMGNCHAMLSAWISKTGIGSTTGISAIKDKSQANISVNGYRLKVNGKFNSIDIYDTAGRKLLSSKHEETELTSLNADNFYVAVVRADKGDASYKFILK